MNDYGVKFMQTLPALDSHQHSIHFQEVSALDRLKHEIYMLTKQIYLFLLESYVQIEEHNSSTWTSGRRSRWG